MIDLSIKIEKPPNTAGRMRAWELLTRKGQAKGVRLNERIGANSLVGKELAYGLAIAHAVALKLRVGKEGRPVDRPREYGSGRRGYLVSPAYPAVKSPRATTRSGALVWRNSQEFHRAQGVKDGSFNVSGGMWSGLSVVPSGGSMATILFRGRSQGQAPNFGTGKQQRRRAERGLGRVVRAKGKAISNAEKAGTVMKAMGVHLLRATTSERESMAAVVEAVVSNNLAAMSQRDPGWSVVRRGDPKFIRDALDAVAGVTALARRV